GKSPDSKHISIASNQDDTRQEEEADEDQARANPELASLSRARFRPGSADEIGQSSMSQDLIRPSGPAGAFGSSSHPSGMGEERGYNRVPLSSHIFTGYEPRFARRPLESRSSRP